MTPAARVAAIIDLVDALEASFISKGLPADRILLDYFRARRYAGGGDRRFIKSHVFNIVRTRGQLVQRLDGAGLPVTPRLLVLLALGLGEDAPLLNCFGAEDGHAPAALDETEAKLLGALDHLKASPCPDASMSEVPDWALAGLQRRFGDTVQEAALSLLERAPFTVRANPLKTKAPYEEIRAIEGLKAAEYSPYGFSCSETMRLEGHPVYKSGKLEIQDEAAQLAALLVAARPGEQVFDLCAGAGGKSLFLAGEMENKGQIYAADIHRERLKALQKRALRAGVRTIQIVLLPLSPDKRKQKLQEYEGKMHKVLVDAPCSGTGTWRRSPELRWRGSRADLEDYSRTQLTLLGEAAALVKKGGQLIYMTCSLLDEENETVVDSFIAGHADFQRVDYRDVWESLRLAHPHMAETPPVSFALNDKDLLLAPHVHGCDGFYVSILRKS